MECIYTIGTSSASHTYGNVASFLRVMLENKFPEHFFDYIYVESKIAWRNISEVLGNNGSEFKKRHYPYMIITPRFTENDQSRYLYNTPLTRNIDNAESGLARNTLLPIIMDKEHSIEIACKLNRDVVTFDVELRLKSLMQQIDVYKNLENQLIWDRPYTQRIALESMIPRSMISYIGKIAGIDINDSTEENNKIPLIMRYLNAHSRYPITYKIRNSTAVDEFFLYYTINGLTTITDINIGDASKKNSIDEYYPLSFRVALEFNLPGLFALIGTHERKFNGMRFNAVISSEDGGSEMMPLYTYMNLYDRFGTDSLDGFQFYSATIVDTDKEKEHKDDIVDIRSIIPSDHMKVLNAFIRDGVPPETLFRFRLLKDDHEIPCNCDELVDESGWKLDWDRKQIVIHNSNPIVTYRIITSANMAQINQKLGMIQDRAKDDIPMTENQN